MAKRIERVDIAQDDVFGKIKESAKNAETEVDALNLTLQAVNAQIDEIKKKALNIKVGSGAKSLADVKAVNEAEKEAIRLAQEREKLEKMRIQTIKLYEKAESDASKKREKQAEKEAKIHAQREKQYNKEIEQANQAGAEYKRFRAELNKLEKQYLDLAVQGRETTDEGRKLLAQINSMRETSDKANTSIKRFNDNVGNYPNTFKSAIGMLSQFGVTLGASFLGGQLISVLKENEDAVAGFRTIVSDLNDTEFGKFQSEINKVANDTKRSTTEIAQSFETIAGLNAEFAKTSDGIGDVSEAVSILSKASKGELQPTAENLVGIMNQFDLSANQADRTINVLAAGQAVGASSIQQSAEAYKNFGSVAKASNIDLEKSQALIQVLGKFSIFGAEAGTKLRGVTLQLQKANLGYASGQFNINDALAEYNEKISKKSSQQDKDALSLKVFGAENITAGKIISANIPLLEKFEKGVTGTDEAQKAAAINSNTLSNRWQELKNQATNLITTNASVGSGLDGLKNTIGFVADNLGTIIPMIAKLTAGFVAFKAIQGVVNTDFKALLSNFTNLKKGADEAGKSTGGFGNALKGVGWTLAIGLAVELGMKLWDVASGAQAARDAMARYEKQLAKSNEETQKKINDLQEREKQRIAELNELLKDKRISQAQYVKLVNEAKNATANELLTSKKIANDRKERYKDLKNELLELKKKDVGMIRMFCCPQLYSPQKLAHLSPLLCYHASSHS